MDEEPSWESLAHDLQIDSREVRLVYERYAARLRFAEQQQIEPIALEQWFRFYYLEKTTEGEQAGPAPSGCSVDGDAVNNACIKRPREFLRLLQAYAREQQSVETTPDRG